MFFIVFINASIAYFIKTPILYLGSSGFKYLTPPLWIPMTLKVSSDKIGDPDEPVEVFK